LRSISKVPPFNWLLALDRKAEQVSPEQRSKNIALSFQWVMGSLLNLVELFLAIMILTDTESATAGLSTLFLNQTVGISNLDPFANDQFGPVRSSWTSKYDSSY